MMDGPISPGRRALLRAGALTMATPVIGAAAQTAPAHREAATFNLWVISDPHVGTDKAASEGILHGMVGFKPPPIYPESLAEALRESENGGAFGGPPIPWEIALNLGDYAGFWDAPEDEQGREVIRQYAVLKQHRREQIYNIAGNHDASPFGAASSEGKEATGGFANGPIRSASTPRPPASIPPSGRIRSTARGSVTRSKPATSGF
jgi:hypothetical protein